jgi:hypothetical protein
METKDNSGWRDNVRKAEVTPSDSVWKGIEFQLDKQEVVQLRSEVVYYKRLAAACITLAVLAIGGGYAWLNTSGDSTTQVQRIAADERNPELNEEGLAYSNQGKVLTEQSNETASITNDNHKSGLRPSLGSERVNTSVFKSDELTSTKWLDQKQTVLLSTYGQKDVLIIGNSYNLLANNNGDLADGNAVTSTHPSTKELVTVQPESSVSPLVKESQEKIDLYASNEKSQREAEKEERKGEERFWTAVGFAAGTFNNITPSSTSTPSTLLQSDAAGETAVSESNSSGQTYSVNLSVGSKISKRWVVHGGMSYISQSSDYTARSVVASDVNSSPSFSVASINEFEKQADVNNLKTIRASTPYSVNNTIQIISLPVQAGYLVFERKLALQVNSGIATDLFLQNTLTPSADNLEKTTRGRGDDSPYRPVNFSGLVSTELSYKFASNYRISLSPGLRYPFSSIYKTDLGLRSTPLTFDVAVRFRYIFH